VSDCANQLSELSALLSASAEYWRPHAFYHLQLPWQIQHPKLSARLQTLSLSQAESLQVDEQALVSFLEDELPCVADLFHCSHLPRFQSSPLKIYPRGMERAIPGRKWQQIQAFIAACELPRPQDANSLLDWCGGKGHLGRCAAVQLGQYTAGMEANVLEISTFGAGSSKAASIDVSSIDIDAQLIAQAKTLSEGLKLPVSHAVVDVLADAQAILNDGYLQSQQQVLSLHACGGLHVQLIERAITVGVQALSIAPCCYHLYLSDNHLCLGPDKVENYRPLSGWAQANNVFLTLSDLRSCVQQTVTAPEHDRRRRKKLQAWRLGFDLLQRHISGQDSYLPVPSLANRWASASFEDVCRHIAHLKHIDIAVLGEPDWPFWEAKGWQRLEWVSAFDLVRMAFRRPLELWLVLDRALRLEEAGYEVVVGEFCEASLSPRNILLEARLPKV